MNNIKDIAAMIFMALVMALAVWGAVDIVQGGGHGLF